MRITEKQLRSIIRNVIKESYINNQEEILDEGMKDFAIKGVLALSLLGAGLATVSGCNPEIIDTKATVEHMDPYQAIQQDIVVVQNKLSEYQNDLDSLGGDNWAVENEIVRLKRTLNLLYKTKNQLVNQ